MSDEVEKDLLMSLPGHLRRKDNIQNILLLRMRHSLFGLVGAENAHVALFSHESHQENRHERTGKRDVQSKPHDKIRRQHQNLSAQYD